jgi:hypothetical protein
METGKRKVLVLMVLQSDFHSTGYRDLYAILKNPNGVRWGTASDGFAAILLTTHEPLDKIHNFVEKHLSENEQVIVFEVPAYTGAASWHPL